jgi:hypothetical protein
MTGNTREGQARPVSTLTGDQGTSSIMSERKVLQRPREKIHKGPTSMEESLGGSNQACPLRWGDDGCLGTPKNPKAKNVCKAPCMQEVLNKCCPFHSSLASGLPS